MEAVNDFFDNPTFLKKIELQLLNKHSENPDNIKLLLRLVDLYRKTGELDKVINNPKNNLNTIECNNSLKAIMTATFINRF